MKKEKNRNKREKKGCVRREFEILEEGVEGSPFWNVSCPCPSFSFWTRSSISRVPPLTSRLPFQRALPRVHSRISGVKRKGLNLTEAIGLKGGTNRRIELGFFFLCERQVLIRVGVLGADF